MNDVYYKEAKEIVIEHQKCSIAFLQIKLRLGYARTSSIVDMLEENNVIGPYNGPRPREVLKSK